MRAEVERELTRWCSHVIPLGILCVAGNAGQAWAQEAELICTAKRVTVASLDSTQPRLQFEEWLRRLGRVSRSAIHWEVNDCGEGGDGRPAPICVEAGLDLAADTVAYATLVVAGVDGSPGPPAVWMLFARTGATYTDFKRLADWAAFVKAHKH